MPRQYRRKQKNTFMKKVIKGAIKFCESPFKKKRRS